jgi:hypothetical protein
MDQHLDFLEFRENGELLLGTSALNRRLVPSLPFEIISHSWTSWSSGERGAAPRHLVPQQEVSSEPSTWKV